MADRVYISWSIENWITVLLMVAVGMFVIGMIASGVRHYSGSASVASSKTGTSSAS